MSAISDPPSATAWPPARPAGISPIQHPAWEAARNFILDLAAEGPVTAIIVGEPGTGKTWLLRELASALGDHGFPTMMLMQGDLPMTLSSGAALLVDEASLMSEAMRGEMSVQQHGVVVLAGVEWFEDELDPASTSPVLVRLRPLDSNEIADFAHEWLHRAGLPQFLDAAALSRLTAQSGGRVGPLVRSLADAVAAWKNPPVALPPAIEPATAPAEPVAVPPPPAATPVPPTLPQRRRVYRPILAASAIAATIALFWALRPAPPAATPETAAPVVASSTPPPLPPMPQAETSQPARPAAAEAAPVAALPPLQTADISSPALAPAPPPAQPSPSNPVLVPPPTPDVNVTRPPPGSVATTLAPAIAEAPAPPVLSSADLTIFAALAEPASTPTPDPPKPADRTGGPGLVLVAQRGDTLERLYGSVYRDRRAPPFATVLAANPGPLKPGAIVVFPEPPGGWQRVQR